MKYSLSNLIMDSSSENEVLIISVDLGDGLRDQITIHDDDIPEDVSFDFCEKHNLGIKARVVLTEEIEKNLQNIYQTRLSRISESSQVLSREDSPKFEKPNKGEELYLKGIKMRQKVEVKNQALRNQRETLEKQNFTFRPSTNSPVKRNKPPEQILLEKGKQTTEMLEKKRFQKNEKMMDGCTFTPEVNKNSKNKSQGRDFQRYQFLYQDAQAFQEKIVKKTQEL